MIQDSRKNGFTMIELLIVIAILAILATAVVLVLNPAQMLAGARDSRRATDLQSLNKVLSLAGFNNIPMGSSSVVYVSIPSSQSDCSDLGLPSLATSSPGWAYRCSNANNYRNTDGTGWVPVNFNSLTSFPNPLTVLPIDPVNSVSTGLYYTYVAGSWELTALLETVSYQQKYAVIDNGASATAYEIGDHLQITPSAITNRSASSGGGGAPAWVCGDSVSYSGQAYGTVLIGTQCWFSQNINVGTKINYDINQGTSCSSIQKYCYSNDENICTSDGAFYQWNQAMCGSTSAGAQGICPSGWHISTDAQWFVLEDYLKDSGQSCDQYRTGWGCISAGVKLQVGGSSGFNDILAGLRSTGGYGVYRGAESYLWSSTENGAYARMRSLASGYSNVYRMFYDKPYGLSVRCLKD